MISLQRKTLESEQHGPSANLDLTFLMIGLVAYGAERVMLEKPEGIMDEPEIYEHDGLVDLAAEAERPIRDMGRRTNRRTENRVAIGHSSRDTFKMLLNRGIYIEARSFTDRKSF